MAKIHDLFIVELAEVIKGYGNDPDVKDPFRLSEFYRFYELPNIAISRENFEKMRPIEVHKTGEWEKTNRHDILGQPGYRCSVCRILTTCHGNYCPNCGAKMEGEE